MQFTNSKFLHLTATKDAILSYLLDVGVPKDLIYSIDINKYTSTIDTVEDILPKLISDYPELVIYIENTQNNNQETNYEYIKRILYNLDVYGDELGTTDVIIAIDTIYNRKIIPEEKLFEIIEELPIDIEELSPIVKEKYLSWKFGTPIVELPSYFEKASEIAKENLHLIVKDVSINNIPQKYTDKNLLKAIPSVLTIGSEQDKVKLYNFLKNNMPIYLNLIKHFPMYLNYLKEAELFSYGKTTELNIPNEDISILLEMFPNTTKELSEKIENYLKKPQQPKNNKPNQVKTASEIIREPKYYQPKEKRVKIGGARIPVETHYNPIYPPNPYFIQPNIISVEEANKILRDLEKKYSKKAIDLAIKCVKHMGLDEDTKEFYDQLKLMLKNKTYILYAHDHHII